MGGGGENFVSLCNFIIFSKTEVGICGVQNVVSSFGNYFVHGRGGDSNKKMECPIPTFVIDDKKIS